MSGSSVQETVTNIGEIKVVSRLEASSTQGEWKLHLRLTAPAAVTDRTLKLLVPLALAKPSRKAAQIHLVDTATRKWKIRRSTHLGDCLFVVEQDGSSNAPKADWTLDFSVDLNANKDLKTISGLKLHAKSVGGFSDLEPITLDQGHAKGGRAPRRRVTLTATPSVDKPLRYGTTITLTCNIRQPSDVGGKPHPPVTGTLWGSFSDSDSISVVNGQSVAVWVLVPAKYVLTANYPDGKGGMVEEHDTILIVPEIHQSGINAIAYPDVMLPGGPVALFYTGVNVAAVDVGIQTDHADQPNLSEASAGVAIRRVIRRSYATRVGPHGQVRSWKLSFQSRRTHQSDDDGSDSSTSVRQDAAATADVSVAATQVATKLTTVPVSPQGSIAAGQFQVSTDPSNPGRRRSASRPTVEWVAAAGGQHTHVAVCSVNKDKLVWHHCQPQIAKVDQPAPDIVGVCGIGDPGNCSHLILASRSAGLVTLFSVNIETMLSQMIKGEISVASKISTLRDADLGPGGIRLLSLGARLYVMGSKAAFSMLLRDFLPAEAASRIADVIVAEKEPALHGLAAASWSVAAVPGVEWDAGAGSLYALDTHNGILLRFDSCGLGIVGKDQGSLHGPFAARPANDRLAQLDFLLWAQSGAVLQEHQSVTLKALRAAGTGEFLLSSKQPQGRYNGEVDPGVIDSRSVLLPVAGTLMARCVLNDRNEGQLQQGRIYDPARNVWARCGQLFPEAKDGALFACTTPAISMLAHSQRGTAGSRSRNTRIMFQEIGSFYALNPDGSLLRLNIRAPLTKLFGFATLDLAPNRALANPAELVDGAMTYKRRSPWRGNRLPAAQTLEEGDYLQSPNGLYRLELRAGQGLVLYRIEAARRAATTNSLADGTVQRWAAQETTLWTQATTAVGLQLSLPQGGALALLAKGNGAPQPLWDVASHGAFLDQRHVAWAARWQNIDLAGTNAEAELRDVALELLDDGSLVLRTARNVMLWRTPKRHQRLSAGQILWPGDGLDIPTGTSTRHAIYQAHGDLAGQLLLRQDGQTIQWQSGTGRRTPGLARLNSNGLLELYDAGSDTSVWSSESRSFREQDVQALTAWWGHTTIIDAKAECARSYLTLSNDGGELIVYTGNQQVLWTTPRTYSSMPGNSALFIGDAIGSAATGHVRLSDRGNLIVEDGNGRETFRALVQDTNHSVQMKLGSDGVLELFGRRGDTGSAAVLWRSKLRGHRPPAAGRQVSLTCEAPGELIIRDDQRNDIWRSSWYRARAMGVDQPLWSGYYLESEDQRALLAMGNDGGLKLHVDGVETPVWSMSADGAAGAVLRWDGVLHLVNAGQGSLQKFAWSGRIPSYFFMARCGGLRMASSGFEVYANDAARTVWYNIFSGRGNSPASAVGLRKVFIRSLSGDNRYLCAAGEHVDLRASRKMALVTKYYPSTQLAGWVQVHVANGEFYLYHVDQGGFLFADDTLMTSTPFVGSNKEDWQRRAITVHVTDWSTFGAWRHLLFRMIGSRLYSVEFDEILFYDEWTLVINNLTARAFSWRNKRDPIETRYPGIVGWLIEDKGVYADNAAF